MASGVTHREKGKGGEVKSQLGATSFHERSSESYWFHWQRKGICWECKGDAV